MKTGKQKTHNPQNIGCHEFKWFYSIINDKSSCNFKNSYVCSVMQPNNTHMMDTYTQNNELYKWRTVILNATRFIAV